MATAVKPRPPQNDSVVERSIATAAGKVRANDLLTGAAALVVLALGYVAVTVVLDKWLVLPEWVRQLGFAGFLAAVAAVAYFSVVVPLRRRVNPRYIARRVEQTIPDAKNVLINWVDLQDRELPGSVKTAVAAKAADGLADADVDTATRSKRLMALLITAGVLVTTLAVLFLVFKWSQFSSLVNRAVNPFASTAIASRTRIDLLEPTGGDATVTDGEQLNVAISLGGRVPDVNGPEKPRLLVRHNPDATGYDEFPLVKGESSREFALMVPRSVIQSGFWYKVAAGDAETPEYRVTVRTRPLLTGFRAEYEYPAYLKWPNDFTTDARVKAPRGTTVTLAVRTNREVKSGTLTTAAGAQSESVRGEVTGEKNGSLRFQFKLQESGTYRVQFQPVGAESPFTSIEYPLDVELDRPPTVTITTPKEEEITLPPNGLLAVDAAITDDHGIVSARLEFTSKTHPDIQGKSYRDGKPFRREKDGTFETEVADYKDSVKLDALTDSKGKPITFKEGDVLEYRVTASDNCEPTANVGASKWQRVRISAPPPAPTPEQQKQQQQKDGERKADEQKAQQQQQERQKNDTRPPDQAKNPDPDKQPQQPQQPQDGKGEKGESGDQKNSDQKGGDQKPDPNQKGEPGKQDATNPMGGGNDSKQPGDKAEPPKQGDQKTDPKQSGEPGKQDTNPMGSGQQGTNDKSETKPDPTTKPEGGSDQKNNGTGSKTDPNTKPDGSQDQKTGGSGNESGAKNDQDLQKQAEKLREKIDQSKSEPGEAKGGGDSTPSEADRKPTAETKPADGKQQSGEKNAAGPKGGEQSGDPKAGEGKDDGTLTDANRAEPKAPPKDAAKGEDKPAGEQTKDGPKGGADQAGAAKESKPEEGDGKTGDKKGSAGEAKGAKPEKGDKTEQPMGNGTESGDKSEAKDPNDMSKAKEKGTPERGGTKKEQPPSKDGSGAEPPKEEKGNGGEAKGDKPQAPGAKKGAQPDKKQDGSPMDQKGPPQDAATEKGAPKPDAADPMAKKTDAAESKGGGDTKPDAKAETKPASDDKGGKPDTTSPKAGGQDQKNPNDQKQPDGGGDKNQKLDPKEMEKAVRDLESNNPKERQAAQEKLDKAMGEQNRKAVEQLQKDLKSEDKATRDTAQQKIDDLAKKAGEQGGKPRELTEGEKKDLADAAQNLNSKDDAQRQAAEQKLDEALGKDKRAELQQDLKDLTGNDPQKAEAAKQKLEKMAQDAKAKGEEPADKQGGTRPDTPGQPTAAKLENQLKSAELNLNEFKKYRGNKDFLKENNLTDAEFEKFEKGYEEMVGRMREELDRERLNPSAAAPLGKPTIRNDASTGRVTNQKEGTALQGAGGVSVAPPGFVEAQKRFAEEAAKRAAEKNRPK